MTAALKLHPETSAKRKYVLEITPQDTAWVFEEFGQPTTDDSILFRRPQDVALVIFTGGHDVWPELYGENAGRQTYFSKERDHYEGVRFEAALKAGIPMVGVCRGSQFLCVKSGGKLVQHVTNHAGAMHTVTTNDGRTITVNSSHHQMQLPGKDAVPLAWAEPKLSRCYLNGDDDERDDVDREYEVVYYPNIKAVGMQYHPEWIRGSRDGKAHPCVEYAQEVVRTYLFGDSAAKAA